MNMIEVKTKKQLDALKNHETGEVALVTKEHKCYVWTGEKWSPVDEKAVAKDGLKLNLYEINKSIISSFDPMSEQNFNDLKETIDNLFTKNYYLLYGKEIGYFTLFQRKTMIIQDPDNPQPSLGKAVVDCLKDFNKTYTFEKLENGAIEIWVDYENQPTVMYLFDYESGVVYYE